VSFTPLFFLFLYIKDYHLFRTQITRIYADLRRKSTALRLTSGFVPKSTKLHTHNCLASHKITQIFTREPYCGSSLRILLALLSHAKPKSCVNLVESRGFLPRYCTNTKILTISSVNSVYLKSGLSACICVRR